MPVVLIKNKKSPAVLQHDRGHTSKATNLTGVSFAILKL